MSTAVLMNDSWKPTVIQLAPFANNKTSRAPVTNGFTKQTQYTDGQKRGFPVLAVTRASPGSEDNSVTQESERSESAVTCSDTNSDVPHSGRKQASAGTKNAKSKSKAKERESDGDSTVRYSVQDLNEQVPRPSSISSVETIMSSSSIGAPEVQVISGPKFLPKPSVTSGRYFINYQQSKGVVKLTPGEVEIQKHKENYVKEQLLKRKKYKLNVNQLPRSTTPINDHDPDKLNMKQVIQFLQNQKSPSKSPRVPHVDISKSSETTLMYTDSQPRSIRHFNSEYIKPEKHLFEKAVLHEGGKVNRNSMGSRGSSTAPSMLSSKSSPLTSKNDNRSSSSSNTAKSMVERRSKRSEKQAKEFKLYRFLSVTSEKEEKPGAHSISSPRKSPRRKETKDDKTRRHRNKMNEVKDESEPVFKYRSAVIHLPSNEVDNSSDTTNDGGNDSKSNIITIKVDDPNDIVDSCDNRHKSSRTANVLHSKARKHRQKTEKDNSPSPEGNGSDSESEDVNSKRLSKSVNGTIRLPSMKDYLTENDDCQVSDDDDDSDVISAIRRVNDMVKRPYSDNVTDIFRNSQKVYAESPRYEYVENSLPIQQLANGYVDTIVAKNNSSENHIPGLGSFVPRNSCDRAQSEYKPSTNQRKIMITIPNDIEHEEPEVVTLSLRHEKDVTPERSYMSDMVRARSKRTPMTVMYHHASRNLPMSNGGDDILGRDNMIRISTMSMQQRKGFPTPEDENITTSMANSCIKVRQKLRANLQ